MGRRQRVARVVMCMQVGSTKSGSDGAGGDLVRRVDPGK